jgi:hopanoid biosynthesis associated RND transporter like protein HpnN
MSKKVSALFGAWVGFVHGRAKGVLLLSLALTLLAGWYAATGLGINTSNNDMLAADLPFRQDSIRYDKAFAQLKSNIVIVIDGASVDQADDAADRLSTALRQRPKLFHTIFDPAGMAFFRQNGLLFLDEDELSEMVDRLAGAQAFLGSLWRDPSLRGLFGVLGLALENADKSTPTAALGRVLDAVAATAAGKSAVLSWRGLIEGKGSGTGKNRRVILVQPALDETSLQPASHAIATIRLLAIELGLTAVNGLRVRLTGSAALEEEELESVATGMGLAGLISAALVLVLLGWCLRSPRLVAAMLATLVIGLIWTAGFATLTVGRLNLISVAFAVLFVGLSVDFGIHFALRLREEIDSGIAAKAGFVNTGRGVGGALALCAVAAAIAFYSFLPTDYVGLAELGVIAGSGMFIALIANLTVLPALIAVFPPVARSLPPPEMAGARAGWVVRNAKPIVAASALLAIAAAALVPSARFDFDPLNLRDTATESVSTLFDLMESEAGGPYSIDILVDNREKARLLTKKLKTLRLVKSVISAEQFVPGGQEAKLAILDNAALLILPSLSGRKLPPPDAAERRDSIGNFRKTLDAYIRSGAGPSSAEARRLAAALDGIGTAPASLADLERRLLATLPGRLAALKDAFNAGPVTFEKIPEPLLRRYVAADGTIRLEIFPKEDVRAPAAMRRFVAAVRTVAPRATGSPVIIVEAGRAVISAFAEAAAISVIVIGLLVWVILRRLRDVALVFAPLGLAALLTVAASVLTGLAFNFANVIVLPLLFGLGVASAIHLVLRERAGSGLAGLFGTSTPRAVVFSALTTIGSFASIALSSHPGTSSMGVLLALAITLSLLCTLVVLPALMALTGRR